MILYMDTIARDTDTTELLRELDAEIAKITDWLGHHDPNHTVLNLLIRSRETIITLQSDIADCEEV